MSNVRRLYVEKKEKYAVTANSLSAEFKSYLGIKVSYCLYSFRKCVR